ncbi:MAG: YkgJ family cysteine cluster protein [Bacillota bacterium]
MNVKAKVAVFPKALPAGTGLDAVILDAWATLQDLVDALEPLADSSQITKPYLPGRAGPCRGCSGSCCTVSLIAPDIVFFLAERNTTTPDLCRDWMDPVALRYGLPRLKSRPCLFLSGDLCSIYDRRPLLCRLFLCTPLSEELEVLIHSATGHGLAELQRHLRGLGVVPELVEVFPGDQYEQEIHRACRQRLFDPVRPFAGVSRYDQVSLQSLVDTRTWSVLTRTGPA